MTRDPRIFVVLAVWLAACSGKTVSGASDAGIGDGGTSFGGAGFGGAGFGGAGFGGAGFGGAGFGGAGFGGAGFGGAGFGGAGFGGAGGYATMPRIGRACAADAECGSDAFCMRADSGMLDGEGPAKGYCTATCTSDASCHGLDPDSVCLQLGSGQFCFESCTPGPDGLSQFDPDKCHGRQEVACTPSDPVGSSPSTLCRPRCNADSDCGGGLHCNPKTGRCTTLVASGLPIGWACGPLTPVEAGTCASNCMVFEKTPSGTPVSMCSQGCTLGASPSCGWSGPGTGPADAACLYAAPGLEVLGGPGIGDLGYCGRLCDCDAECLPQQGCVEWPGPNGQATKDFFQRNGYCGVDPSAVDAAVVPCDN